MKNWKSYPILLASFFVISLGLLSCGEDREAEENAAYIVDIEIITPTNNATMAVGEDFNVEVDYARKENTIHNIKVEIVDEQGVTVHKLVERHAHVADEFTFQSEAVSIGQAGTYFVRASSTDLQIEGDNDNHGSGDVDNMVEHVLVVQ